MKSIFATVLMVVCLAVTVSAVPPAAPHLMTFQGRLLDNAGNPLTDGPKGVRIVIWNDPTGSAPSNEVWNSGALTVTTEKGLFSVTLGASPQPAIDPNSMQDSARWIGITVGADPEMTPRVRLGSTPYAWTAQNAGSVDWAGVANKPAGFADGVDDNTTYSASGGIALSDTNFSLSSNGVTAAHILDEPGIAASLSAAQLFLSSNAAVDILGLNITIPAAGYIVVEGKFYGITTSTLGYNMGFVQIDENVGGGYLSPYLTIFGANQFSNAGGCYWPGSVYRIYYKGSAGTYFFRMEGGQYATSAGAVLLINNPMMKATYFPTSYGAVTSVVSSYESGQFDKTHPIPTGDALGQPTGLTNYEVDLRELELKTVKARAEAEEAQRKLLEAQLQLERAKSDSATAGK